MAFQEDSHGLTVAGAGTAVTVACTGSGEKGRLPGGKAVLQDPGKLNWEAAVLFPVNQHNRAFYGGRQPGGAHPVRQAAVEKVHPKQDHGTQQGSGRPVEPAVKTQQGRPGVGVTGFQEEQLNFFRPACRCDDATSGTCGMAVEDDRFSDPVNHGLDILGEPESVHHPTGA